MPALISPAGLIDTIISQQPLRKRWRIKSLCQKWPELGGTRTGAMGTSSRLHQNWLVLNRRMVMYTLVSKDGYPCSVVIYPVVVFVVVYVMVVVVVVVAVVAVIAVFVVVK